MSSSNCIIPIFGILLLSHLDWGLCLMCYICGQHGLPPPAECATQFQYDCASYARRFDTEQTIFCRTTRQRYGNNTYSIQKECISLVEHEYTFPGGRLEGCDHFFDENGFEVSYCLCDHDFCNKRPLQAQVERETVRTQHIDLRYHDLAPPPLHPQAGNVSVGANVNVRIKEEESRGTEEKIPVQVPIPASQPQPQRAAVPPRKEVKRTEVAEEEGEEGEGVGERSRVELGPSIVDIFTAPPPTLTPDQPIIAQPPSTEVPRSRSWTIPYKPDPIHLVAQPTAGSVRGLVCMVCSQTEVEGVDPECVQQQAMDCGSQFPEGVATFCFSRVTFLSNGKSTVEKMCMSDLGLLQAFGEGVEMQGCVSTWEGRVNYCVCDHDKCNERSVKTQFSPPAPHLSPHSPPPPTASPPFPTLNSPTPIPLMGSNKCYVCGESDLEYPTECSEMYEYDCSLAYAPKTSVFCLTRQTKLPTGLFAIEKRCISEEQHKQQYPGAEIVTEGCGSAWNGYVEYCVCRTDYCNRHNLTNQQLADGVQPFHPQTIPTTSVPQTTLPTTLTPLPPRTPKPVEIEVVKKEEKVQMEPSISHHSSIPRPEPEPPIPRSRLPLDRPNTDPPQRRPPPPTSPTKAPATRPPQPPLRIKNPSRNRRPPASTTQRPDLVEKKKKKPLLDREGFPLKQPSPPPEPHNTPSRTTPLHPTTPYTCILLVVSSFPLFILS